MCLRSSDRTSTYRGLKPGAMCCFLVNKHTFNAYIECQITKMPKSTKVLLVLPGLCHSLEIYPGTNVFRKIANVIILY